MKRKFIALLLACLCLIVPLVGCSDEKGPSGGGLDLDNIPTDDNLTTKNWKGATFSVLTYQDRGDGQAFNVVDLEADEDKLTDAIQKAVYERNNIVSTLYNAKIERLPEKDYEDIANNTLAHGEEYSAYMLKVSGALNLALTDVLFDLSSEVNYLNLAEDWWDTSALETLSINGRTYFALGDINTVDDDATWCVLFNKALQKKYNTKLPNFYDAVKNNTWTIENMARWAQSATVDDNTDSSKWWEADNPYQYGIYMQTECATVLLQSSGIKLFNELGSGLRTSNLNSGEINSAIDSIKGLMEQNTTNSKWALNLNTVESKFSGDTFWRDIARGGFMANKALFFFCHCGTIELLRDMESDFGILPVPKVDESQEEYGNTIQYGNATCYVIPFNTPDEDFSAFMLEALGFYSSRSYNEETCLKTAYYNTTLQRKASRDDESWDMLDIVFQNRKFDIACAMNTQGINSMIQNACTNSNTSWSTLVASNNESILTNLNKDLAKLLGVDVK